MHTLWSALRNVAAKGTDSGANREPCVLSSSQAWARQPGQVVPLETVESPHVIRWDRERSPSPAYADAIAAIESLPAAFVTACTLRSHWPTRSLRQSPASAFNSILEPAEQIGRLAGAPRVLRPRKRSAPQRRYM